MDSGRNNQSLTSCCLSLYWQGRPRIVLAPCLYLNPGVPSTQPPPSPSSPFDLAHGVVPPESCKNHPDITPVIEASLDRFFYSCCGSKRAKSTQIKKRKLVVFVTDDKMWKARQVWAVFLPRYPAKQSTFYLNKYFSLTFLPNKTSRNNSIVVRQE